MEKKDYYKKSSASGSQQQPPKSNGKPTTPPPTALELKSKTVDAVQATLARLQQSGELELPADYSVANAMKSAWLVLQGIKDKNDKPVLEICTRESICNSLMDMAVQGLNPQKKQVYFIPYGKTLTAMRSYFGTEAIARRVDPRIGDIVTAAVYEGDVFEYEITRGRKSITKHTQKIENVGRKITAAYCEIYSTDGELLACDIMSWPEILQSWKQSQVHPVDDKGNLKPGTTHAKFPAEMAKRTVENRCLKPIVNASNDSYLKNAFHRTDESGTETTASPADSQSDVIDIQTDSYRSSGISDPNESDEQADSETVKAAIADQFEKLIDQHKLDRPSTYDYMSFIADATHGDVDLLMQQAIEDPDSFLLSLKSWTERTARQQPEKTPPADDQEAAVQEIVKSWCARIDQAKTKSDIEQVVTDFKAEKRLTPETSIGIEALLSAKLDAFLS